MLGGFLDKAERPDEAVGRRPGSMPAARSGRPSFDRLRLWSGLMLFTYLTTHFLNHALGLVSLDAMLAGREWFLAALAQPPRRRSPSTPRSLVHCSSASGRSTGGARSACPGWEALQLSLGLTIPPAPGLARRRHAAGPRGGGHAGHLHRSWCSRSGRSIRGRACARRSRSSSRGRTAASGLHFWLRLRPWYPRVRRAIYSGFLLVPVLALLGFAEAGREISAAARETRPSSSACSRDARPAEPGAARVLGRVARGALLGRPRDRSRCVLAARGARERVAPPRSASGSTYPGRPRGAGARRVHAARGEPLRRHPARLRLRRARPLLDLPRARDPRRRAPARRRPPRSCACSSGWARPPTCAWPARCGRRATSRWCRSCRRAPAPPTRSASATIARAAS